MNKYYLDTNIVIRFLLQDHKTLSRKANRIFEEADNGDCSLILTDVAVAEAVWVLTSVYKIERQKVGETLTKLIIKRGIICRNKIVMIDALSKFSEVNCDFFDCYFAALAEDSGDGVASFDSDLKKFSGVTLWQESDQ